MYISFGNLLIVAIFGLATALYLTLERGNPKQLSPRKLGALKGFTTFLLCLASFIGGLSFAENYF